MAQPCGRFEDDVVPFLKMVRYPFTISKSSLAAVGAPQTWPKVGWKRGGGGVTYSIFSLTAVTFHFLLVRVRFYS